MISKKKRIQLGRSGLLHQYGDRARKFSIRIFNKDIHDLTLEDLDILGELLHKSGVFR